MSQVYPLVKLEEILTQDKKYIEAPEVKIYPKLSVKLYGKGVVLDEPADGATLKMRKHQIAKSGQVILSEIWGKKGAIGFVPQKGDGALCTSHFFLFDVNHKRVDPQYLQLIFSNNFLEEQLNAEAKGSTGYAAVRPKYLLSARIPLPSLEEQRRIVGRIEELAGKIAEARRLREGSIGDCEAILASEKNAVFNSEFMARYPSIELGLIADIRAGVTLGRRLNGITINLPYLRVANVQDGYLDLKSIKTVEIYEPEQEKWKLQIGDLLLTEGGDWDKLGRGTVWNNEIENCIHQNHIYRIRFDQKEFDPYYLSILMSSPYGKSYFQSASKQTTNLASINQKQLKAFIVFQPPLTEQRRIVEYLDELQAKVDEMKRYRQKSLAELDALLPAILDKAFKGEL